MKPKFDPAKPTRQQGLLGLFGHTLTPDEEGEPGAAMIQYQFQVLRTMRGERYVVQLFSFMDGRRWFVVCVRF
jgi:hypothetical protein